MERRRRQGVVIPRKLGEMKRKGRKGFKKKRKKDRTEPTVFVVDRASFNAEDYIWIAGALELIAGIQIDTQSWQNARCLANLAEHEKAVLLFLLTQHRRLEAFLLQRKFRMLMPGAKFFHDLDRLFASFDRIQFRILMLCICFRIVVVTWECPAKKIPKGKTQRDITERERKY